MSSHYGLGSYVKSSEVRYYLELKAKEDRVLKRQKGKDSIHENNKNVYPY